MAGSSSTTGGSTSPGGTPTGLAPAGGPAVPGGPVPPPGGPGSGPGSHGHHGGHHGHHHHHHSRYHHNPRLPPIPAGKKTIVVTGWGELPENDPNNPNKNGEDWFGYCVLLARGGVWRRLKNNPNKNGWLSLKLDTVVLGKGRCMEEIGLVEVTVGFAGCERR